MFRQPKKHAKSTSSKGNAGNTPTPPTPPTPPDRLYFEALEANTKIYMTTTMPNTHSPNLNYTKDNVTWYSWGSSWSGGVGTYFDITLENVGDRVYIWGSNDALADMTNLKFSTFKIRTGSAKAGGSVQSLINGYEHQEEAVCMARLFYYCDRLKAAPLLTATKVHANDYWQMFSHCTGLASLPDDFRLPATDLGYGCYAEMFANCTALASLPDGFTLPATALAPYCYNYMFYQCSALASLPGSFGLSADELANGCYQLMFDQCTFDMSDDGETFSFPVGATLPQTVDGTTYATPADLAAWMGNTNGFII